ncbi:MAG: hypothetical protein K9H16_14750, partial [Bacteroidales bacterium]|nr:hypothetical protein [Bacteroidales bacterium]
SFARDTMAQLRETIWALNAENITLDQLSSRVAEFINHAKLAGHPVTFSLESTASERVFNASQAINIFRTIQEAVNNAMKYAEANNILIKLSDEKITISDNGKGFDRKMVVNGNGLKNMEARMEEAGFKTLIRSTPAKGTEISILLS